MSKIESRFRKDSKIEHGNTLVEDAFYNDSFDIVIANPPYGVSWKGYEKEIKADKTGCFKYVPSISDGQLLFMQHLISKMKLDGMGVVVHNGSTLFSGDAGSAESNIRKWLLDSDIVEAVIQLPTDEFFNTGIYTYLWVLNWDKKPIAKDKIMLINASDKFTPLKKSKDSKRKEVDAKNRLEIVETLMAFKDNDYARVFDKEHFYFNKQAIMLTNVDEEGNSFATQLKPGKKSDVLKPLKLTAGDIVIDTFSITTYDSDKYDTLGDAFKQSYKPLINSLDYKEQDLVIETKEGNSYYDTDKETLIRKKGKDKDVLGCGKIVVKTTFKKATKTRDASIAITVELIPDLQKDYEIIPYYKDEAENQKAIDDFMAKYISKPFELLGNVVGVELNFNKIFYKPEKKRYAC